MSRVRQLPGGGRAVEVPADRIAGWFQRYADNHGGAAHTVCEPRRVEVLANDGSTATVAVPFEPLPPPHGRMPGLAVDRLVDHMRGSRRVGVILVRRGAHSIGVVRDGHVEFSSTDRHLVQGRSKAGGWSQQRFARRRKEQSRKALESTADAVARTLVPIRAELDALVLGGDRQALDALRADPRLAELLAAAEPRVLDVPEPRRVVLDDAAVRVTSVEIEIRDSPSG